jgi:hypothetical protein
MLGNRIGTVPPTPSRWTQQPGPRSASYSSRSAGDVPAVANAGPSGHGSRTTGLVQVLGSRGSTPRPRSSFSMTATHARTVSGATAPRTTRNPSAQKLSMVAVISLTKVVCPNARYHPRPKAVGCMPLLDDARDGGPRVRASGASGSLPQSLRRYSQRAIELAGGILPGDDRGQFDQCIVVVSAAKPREEVVVYLTSAEGHAVRVLQGDPLRFVVQRASGIVGQCENLGIGQSQFAADGSVDVLSELAAVQRCDPAIE